MQRSIRPPRGAAASAAGSSSSAGEARADDVEPVEQPRDVHARDGPRLVGSARRAAAMTPGSRRPPSSDEHAHEPEPLGLDGADVLLEAGMGPRHDQGRACRATGSRRTCCSRPSRRWPQSPCSIRSSILVSKAMASRLRVAGDALEEAASPVPVHERPEDDEGRQLDRRVGLVGGDHPVDEVVAVAAAAGRDQRRRAPWSASGSASAPSAAAPRAADNRCRRCAARRRAAGRAPSAARRSRSSP